MEIHTTDTENKYFNDLWVCCDTENIGKIPAQKANLLFHSAHNKEKDFDYVLSKILSLAGVPQNSLYLTRKQFYSCLKLIAAYQASIPLREEILTTSTIQLPLPKLSWNLEHDSSSLQSATSSNPSSSGSSTINRSTLNTLNTSNGILLTDDRYRSPDLIELSKDTQIMDNNLNSDIQSTDSEVEQNEHERRSRRRSGATVGSNKHGRLNNLTGGGSPETWSTASDSPTPTNSVAERPWAVGSQSWQGLLCEEQRQLLGTEEESDKHSSDDDDDDDLDLDALYQITPEQKDYYIKQFRSVQPDIHGLLSGVVAKVFFEKSRIPIEELRHIWQLCDVTRDGALDIAEFTAAMHLVVLRRNNIPIPSNLPSCLLPNLLYKTLNLPHNEPLAEADLLHLESDTDNDNKENVKVTSEYKRMSSSTYESRPANNTGSTPKTSSGGSSSGSGSGSSGSGTITIINKASTLPKNHHSQYRLDFDDATTTNKINKLNNNTSKTIIINKSVINPNSSNNNNNNNSNNNNNNNSNSKLHRSSSNSPFDQFVVDGPTVVPAAAPIVDSSGNQGPTSPKGNKEWTKFTESPTSNVSSPGPKPVNVTQAIVSDTHVIHPVPLRVTPVGPDTADDDAIRTFRKADSLVYESGVVFPGLDTKKSQSQTHYNQLHSQRDSLPSDFRAIQRPQPKKPASKNIGAIPPPPPQRENSFNHNDETGTSNNNNTSVIITSNNSSVILTNKKEAPPLPPPRPHRHTRSSSLDLQKIKLSNAQQQQHQSQDNDDEESSSKPPENPPPRISDKKQFKMPSYDAYVNSDASFADFAHFPTESNQKPGEYVTTICLDSNPNPSAPAPVIPQPQPRSNLTNTLIGQSNYHRSSAFEVYRKPGGSGAGKSNRNSQSPQTITQMANSAIVSIAPPPSAHPHPHPTGGSATTITIQQQTSTESATRTQEYEKRVTAISDNLRAVRFKKDQNIQDVLKHLKEQNLLLLRLCNDLSEELSSVQKKKEEVKLKLEIQNNLNNN